MAGYSNPLDEAFFGAVGRMTISWASLEMGIDIMVDIVHRALGGDRIEPERPRMLQRKLKYLRRFFRSLNLRADSLQGFLDLLQEIEEMSETRHDIIHGAVIEHVEGSGTANFIRLLHKEGAIEQKQLSFTSETVMKAAIQTMKLSNQTISAVRTIQDELLALLSQQNDARSPS